MRLHPRKALTLALGALLYLSPQGYALAPSVVIERGSHRLGDGFNNEGTVFEKPFFLQDVSPNLSLEFYFLEPLGPNFESPPEVFINSLFAGDLSTQFPPLDLAQSEWVTNPDNSHDYNGRFHVSLPVTPLLVEGENLFRIQNGRPDDDYYFGNVVLIPEPTTLSLLGLGSLALVMARRRR